MANRLTMAEIDRILTLHTTEHSNREIADLLGINRETVGKYVAQAKAENQPNAPSGSQGPSSSGPRSECEPFRDFILAKVEQGIYTAWSAGSPCHSAARTTGASDGFRDRTSRPSPRPP